MKRIVTIFVVIVCLGVAATVFRSYPRTVSLSLKGVEHQLGHSSHYGRKPIAIQVNGTVKIGGTQLPNHGMIQSYVNLLASGDPIAYLDRHSNVVTYGLPFTNARMNKLTIEVYQPKGGWNSGNGVMISAPATTRTQALRISNDLVKSQLLPGHPLK